MVTNWIAWSNAVTLLILVICISKSECDELVPVEKVGETELFTGVWYSIDLKSKGRLGYSNAKEVEGKYNHLLIDRKDVDFCNSGPETEWMMIPTEKKSLYLFRNRKIPNAAIGYAGKSPSGKWVVADMDHASDPIYQEGGQYRDGVLWRFEKSSKGYNNIYNNGFPDNGIMTYSFQGDKNDDKIKYVQIYDTGSPDKFKNDSDYQWKFTRSKFENLGKNIPGTNLYTATPYRIHLKSMGLLTWSFSKLADSYNYIQIVFGNTEKKDYKEGARYYKDSIWTILETEKTGYYLLVNNGIPDAAITTAGKSPSGKWVVADMGHANDPVYQKNGEKRPDVLWKFETEEGVNDDRKFNRIYNSRYPGNGIMTYSSKDTGSADRKFVQIYDTGSAQAYKHNADYLWRFTAIIPKK